MFEMDGDMDKKKKKKQKKKEKLEGMKREMDIVSKERIIWQRLVAYLKTAVVSDKTCETVLLVVLYCKYLPEWYYRLSHIDGFVRNNEVRLVFQLSHAYSVSTGSQTSHEWMTLIHSDLPFKPTACSQSVLSVSSCRTTMR